jgi:translation initiation factor 2D
MFHKENSSTTTKGAKKSKDVPLRKTDRKRLWKTAEQFFAVQVAENADAADTAEDNNNNNSNNTHNDERAKSILEIAFLQGNLSSRILHMATGDKVTCIYRSPIGYETKEEGDAASSTNTFSWPYTNTRSPQCIWMQVQRGANQEPWQVPSVALLAVLAHAAATATTPTTATNGSSILDTMPVVTVPAQVSRYLCRGADLMKAGMRSLPSREDLARTAGVVAVCIQGNPQPMAVGHLHESIMNDYDQADNIGVGCKGVGVTIISAYGDDLWKQQMPLGTNSNSKESSSLFDAGHYGNAGFRDGTLVLPIVEGFDEDDSSSEEEEEEGDETDTVEVKSNAETPDSTTPFDPEDSDGADTPNDEHVDATATTPNADTTTPKVDTDELPALQQEETEELSPPPPLTPEEVLHAAVCKALVSIRPKQDLPMTVANFYAQHVLPSRPAGTTVQLKQTQYKKLGPYIQEQVNEGLLVMGPDASKKDPMAMLVNYNRRHPDLYEYIQENKANPAAAGTSSSASKKLVLLQLYCIPNHFVSLLRLEADVVKAAGATSTERRGTGMLTQKEMRSVLDDYIAKEELVHPTRPAQIQLDGSLTDALYKKKKQAATNTGSSEAPPPAVMSRKDVVALWQTKMEAAFCLVETPGNRIIQLARGKPPAVQVEVVMRQSKKFLTRVRGLEDFGLDPINFCKDVAHRFACSGSVEDQVDGRAALRKGHAELVFQGNLADELEALLLSDESLTSHGGAKGSDYHLPNNSIEVTLRKGVPPRKRRQPVKKR